MGPGGVLTGTSRINQEAKEKFAALQRDFEISRKRRALEAQAASLQAELVTLDREAEDLTRENKKRERQARVDQADLAKSRGAN
jgi:circadian clock protein KaiC